MKLLTYRREAALAERHLQRERATWHADATTLRSRVAHHRGALAVGAGAAAGLLCGFLPLRAMARVGRLVASVAGFVLRTPIGAMLIDGIKHRPPTQTAAPTDAAT